MVTIKTDVKRPNQDALANVLSELRERFQSRVTVNADICHQHANTLTWIENQPPDAVVFANSTNDVADVVKLAAKHKVPVIAFGAGTSLEGHTNAPRGGISLDLSGMNAILKVNAQDLDCRIEAGVTRAQLNVHLRDTGLFFPVDPGADQATLGGMAATRASGTCAVRYGTMRENVLNVTAVMADGAIVTTGARARKSAAGYDLTRLLVGSEGTLGIITELTVKLFGVPEVVLSAVAPFDTLVGACNATSQAMQLGLGIARIELLDPLQIRAVNQHSGTEFFESPTLFLEFHGSQSGAREQVATFEEIARAEGARAFQWAEQEEDRKRLWKARHDVFWSIKTAWPGKKALVTDVCVPISRLAECVGETYDDIAQLRLTAPIVGHVGDGNFHALVMFDEKDADERSRVDEFSHRLNARAIAMDGTCTGEHGVGQGKMAYLADEAGPGLSTMRAIKKALDPDDILNPGKIIALE